MKPYYMGIDVSIGFDYNHFTNQWYLDSLNMGVNSHGLGYYGPTESQRFDLSY